MNVTQRHPGRASGLETQFYSPSSLHKDVLTLQNFQEVIAQPDATGRELSCAGVEVSRSEQEQQHDLKRLRRNPETIVGKGYGFSCFSALHSSN